MTLVFQNVDIDRAHKQFSETKLAIINNVLSADSAIEMQKDVFSLQKSAKKNVNMKQVHSGELLRHPDSLVHTFMRSPEVCDIVNSVIGGSTALDICPCANRAKYNLYLADFGCKLNFYEGNEPGIGWHYDKESCWTGPTYVVIYTVMLRRVEESDVGSRLYKDTPAVYDIFEDGKIKSFVIAENSLHIHDTRKIYHRAFVPKGFKRSALVMHFSTAPCTVSDKVVGFSLSCSMMNVVGRVNVLLYHLKSTAAAARSPLNQDSVLAMFVSLLLILSLVRVSRVSGVSRPISLT